MKLTLFMIRRVTAAVTVALVAHIAPVYADIVDTSTLTSSSQAEQDKAKIQSFLDRASVAEKLQGLGVNSLMAKDRVNALSEQEAHALAERIDAMPAGGNLSQMDIILILLIAILIAIAL